jgi:putative transposase
VNCSSQGRKPLVSSIPSHPKLRRGGRNFGGLCQNRNSSLLAAGATSGHAHLLVSLGREYALASLVGEIKANASKWIHETFNDAPDFAWQAGYGAFSVSHSNLPAVRKYIARQLEHHRRRTFQEEFLDFLKRHEIKYDERYIWA